MNQTTPIRKHLSKPLLAHKIHCFGKVQGVGFRPHVTRLARSMELGGSIQNVFDHVVIHIEGSAEDIHTFIRALHTLPAPIQIERIESQQCHAALAGEFSITHSASHSGAGLDYPLDHGICPLCLTEFNDPHNRRYQYPFISCNDCGPRFSILKTLPFDRGNTSFASFLMCAQCEAEYKDPENRRFHSQTISCPACGPTISCNQLQNTDAITHAIGKLREGKIVAVKSLGGYHLMCDAQNENAIKELRKRKHRPHKPFALLVGETDLVNLETDELGFLNSAGRAILLAEKNRLHRLPEELAPGLSTLGVMLPANGLQHHLLRGTNGPLLATSANIQGEPIIYDSNIAEKKLSDIADCFLHHNLEIINPLDDSVFHFVGGEFRPLRLARGYAPKTIPLKKNCFPPSLGLGAQDKNAFCYTEKTKSVIFPHIGNLESAEAFKRFRAGIQAFSIKTDIECLYDAHPHYTYTAWARDNLGKIRSVLHHHAHASAVAARHPHDKWLVFTWDGAGYGVSGEYWGGECFYGTPGNWKHVATLHPFRLPGADQATKEPWRIALSLLYESGHLIPAERSDHEKRIVEILDRDINSPRCSSIGRLFDGVAALLGFIKETSYEAQAAMCLEAHAKESELDTPSMRVYKMNGLQVLDWRPLIPHLINNAISHASRAGIFHTALAHGLFSTLREIEKEIQFDCIGLAGGVFQNRVLCEKVFDLLKASPHPVFLPEEVPCNDASISYGQVIEALYRQGVTQ
ncbi:MAG: carbamoyltransferase HypF [Gammaproteobacteria bacterium]|nr:carbamoyltransferase HypF [Gammaproteobacteria bacterium]MDH5692006.1 carbamoyltransferase HypF [Gammaproteobacteria bacterium]